VGGQFKTLANQPFTLIRTKYLMDNYKSGHFSAKNWAKKKKKKQVTHWDNFNGLESFGALANSGFSSDLGNPQNQLLIVRHIHCCEESKNDKGYFNLRKLRQERVSEIIRDQERNYELELPELKPAKLRVESEPAELINNEHYRLTYLG
jgi:hypothetical protein